MNQQKKRLLVAERNGNGSSSAARREAASTAQAESIRGDPPEAVVFNWTLVHQVAVVGMALVTAIAVLYAARSILMPVLAAMLIGISLRPIQLYLARYKVPAPVTAIVLLVSIVGAAGFIVTLVAGSLAEWIAQAPDIGVRIQDKMRWLDRPLDALRDLQEAVGGSRSAPGSGISLESALPTMLQSAAAFLTPAVSELLLFLGTLLFFLVGTERMRRRLITVFGTRDARLTVLRIWNDVEHSLIAYLGTVTVINLGMGVATAVMLYAIGFPNPLAFGALAFVLNYIPYIGPALVVASLLGVGLIGSPSLGSALLPPFLFVVLATLEGHVITPSIVGRRLTLSPFLVFLALAFWTWLWGPLGAFMATPLLIVGLVVLGTLFPREEVELPK